MSSDSPVTTDAPVETRSLHTPSEAPRKEPNYSEPEARQLAHQEAQLKLDRRRTNLAVLSTWTGVVGLLAGLATAVGALNTTEARQARLDADRSKIESVQARLEADRSKLEAELLMFEIERKESLRQRDDAFRDRDAALYQRDAAYEDRDNAILQRDEAASERNDAVRERDVAVTERDQATAALEAIKTRTAFAKADLESTQRELDSKNWQLETSRTEELQLKDELRTTSDQLAEQRRVLSNASALSTSEFAAHQAAFVALEERAKELLSLIASKDTERAAMQVEINRLREELVNRATKPATIIAGNYADAEKRYAHAAEIEPRSFDAQYMHGLTLQLLGRTSEAVRAYLRALSIRPDDFEANLNLATAYLQLKEPAQALSYAQRAVRINPSSGPARVNLGAVYAALDRHAEAITEYLQAAELTELSPELLLNLADSFGKSDRYAEMVSTLEQLVSNHPSAIAYERLGFARFRARNFDAALASFRSALEIDPSHYPALNGVGTCLLNRYASTGRSDEAIRKEAIRALRRSLQIEPKQPKILDLVKEYD
jgi:tetratricopeptide (TPR) repeat protein